MIKLSLSVFMAFLLVSFAPTLAHAQGVSAELQKVQEEWAHIKYEVQGKDAKLAAIKKLEEKVDAIVANNAKSAEAKIWSAIVWATDANITKSISGLPKVEKAKTLLEESLKINPKAMNGSAHMTLGSLYFQVPGWPVGFGDDKLAEQHLKKALEINPNGMDTNYWYGEFLRDDGRLAEAKTYLERAKAAPIRPERKVADTGRLKEIEDSLSKLTSTQKTKAKGNE